MPPKAEIELVRVSWTDAEPTRFAAEQAAMAALVPELLWCPGDVAWRGTVPPWPFKRAKPPGLDAFLADRRLVVRVEYLQAFPMVAPRVVPLDPAPDPMHRGQHAWHVNPDGSLCLLQAASDWDGTGTAADLVLKAAGWFIEYLLMEAERSDSMTAAGIVNDACLDHLLTGLTH